jgi:capsular exopolysaccharide synthesis family protein
MNSDQMLLPSPQWRPPLQKAIDVLPVRRDFSLLDLWKVVNSRRRLLIGTVLAFLILAIGYCLFIPPLYRSEAKLQVLNQDYAAGLSSYDPAQASATVAADALDFNLAVQTEVDVIQSRNLALRVIHEVKLDQEPDYQLRGDQAENAKPLEESPKHLAFVLAKFKKRLQAGSISGTRLVSVSFMDRSPQRAAQVVNQLIADFIEYNFQVRFAASSVATNFLANELRNMKSQVDESQANVVQLQQQSGIYGVDEANNATNAKLEQLNAQHTIAQANKFVKQSLYRLAITKSPEVLVGMIGSQAAGANTASVPLQQLRQQQADAAATYAELNARYGSEYPKVLQAGERLQSIQASINGEIDRLVSQAAAEYRVASDTEAAAARALKAQEAVASKMNHDALLYTSAKHEADTNRNLYEQLLKRLKEADVLAGLRSTNLNVLDPAVAPSKLAQPLFPIYLLVALCGGFFAGIVVVFVADAMDGSVRDPQKIEEAVGVPVLALIPQVETSLPKVVLRSLRHSIRGSAWQYQTTTKAPRSTVAEAFRALRTAILSSMPGRHSRVLAITSTSESEGKSFTTFNLAAAFAQAGHSVLVVDADLRKRTLSHALGLEKRDGLDDAIADSDWRKYIIPYEEVPGLSVLPAGQQNHYPADVLGSVIMTDLIAHLHAAFDIVLIDTPSILAVTDTVSLSTFVDAVVVVAKCGITPQHSLVRTLDVLRRARARVLGVVLNGIDFASADFYYFWGKQGSGYVPTAAQILTPAPKTIASRVAGLALLGVLSSTMFTGSGRAQSASQPATQSIRSSEDATTAQKVQIGNGDLLSINVYDAPELSQEVRVGSSGTVHLILLGDIYAIGLQPDQLANSIEAQLSARNLIHAPHVSVTVKEFTTQGVTVEGEVKKPGLYPIFSTRNLVDIIALAEGTTSSAGTQITIIRHATGAIEHVTLSQSSGSEVASSDLRVYPGDKIIVPRAGIAYVLGDVLRPGGYIMHDNGGMTILQAISEAQGTTRIASLKHVILLRKTGTSLQTIPIQLKAIQRGQRPDQQLQSGDVIFVPTSGIKSFGQDTAGVFASISGAAIYAVH